MAPVIRAAALSPEPRKLERRLGGVVAREPLASPPAGVPTAPAASPSPAAPTVADLEAQQRWQSQAQQELFAALESARAQGHAEGHAQGLAEAQAVSRDKLHQLDGLIEAAGRSFTAQVSDLEDMAVSIAFEALVKLLGEALVTPSGVQAVVSQVLQQAKDQEKLIVRLSPGDFYLLLQHRPEAPALMQSGIELVPDERVALGGCLVETGAGSLDGRIETQLESLRRVLLQARGEGRWASEAGR